MTKKKIVALIASQGKTLDEKSLADLHKRIRRKEIRLLQIGNELIIHARVAILTVKYAWKSKRNGIPLVSRLIEKERMHHGKKPEPCHRWDGIGKKILFGEQPEHAAERCIQEKLHMKGVLVVRKQGTHFTVIVNHRFGGLPIAIERIFFDAIIPEERFNPYGYTFERKKTSGDTVVSRFEWIPEFAEK